MFDWLTLHKFDMRINGKSKLEPVWDCICCDGYRPVQDSVSRVIASSQKNKVRNLILRSIDDSVWGNVGISIRSEVWKSV